jgi:hypothetical protein
MSPARCTFARRLGIAVFATALGTGAGFAFPHRAASADADGSAVLPLLQERYAALKEIATLVERLHALGRASAGEVRAVHRDLHRAELDLCETEDARVAVLGRMLEAARTEEGEAEAARKNGMGTAIEALQAKVARLEVQIEFEQARGG